MKQITLERIAKRVGESYKDQFEYWNDILFSQGTALCFYDLNDDGIVTVITDPEKFPKFCTRPYIKRAIENNAICLGACQEGGKWLRFDQI